MSARQMKRRMVFFGVFLVSAFLVWSNDSAESAAEDEKEYALEFLWLDTWTEISRAETSYELDFAGEFTLEAWIYPYIVDEWQKFVGIRGHHYPYLINIHNNGRGFLGYSYEEDGETRYRNEWGSSANSPGANTWTHMAVSKENLPEGKAVMKLYINGEKDAELELIAGYNAPSNNLWMSGSSARDTRRKAIGLIGEVRVWESVLGREDIRDNMHRKLDGDEKGLAGYWKLNEGEGGTALDSTPNSNHVEITGARWVEKP